MIDKNAIVDPKATLANSVTVGPFSIIGPDVTIDEGTVIGPHVVIKGPTKIGKNNHIFQFASVGEVPQDKKFHGEYSLLEIGDNNIIRECCTFNRGTEQGGGITRVGSNNLFMAYVHIAHDCIVGNHTVFSNNASLAGHVVVDDYAILGGFAVVGQFCRLGAYSFTCGSSVVIKDIPPYIRVSDHYAKPYGLNVVGLQRNGFSEEAMNYLKQAYRFLFRSELTLEDGIAEVKKLLPHCAELKPLIDFLDAPSKHGIIRG